MHPSSPAHKAIRLIIIASLLALAPSTASAKDGFDDDWEPPDNHRAYSREFNGTFTDLSARFGLLSSRRSDYSGRAVDVGARISFPAYVGDLRLSYRNDAFSSDDNALAPITMHSVGVGLGLHPAYLLVLGSDWISYIASGFYLDMGLGAQLGVRTLDGVTRRDPGAYFHAGMGVDVPLWDPDVGFALWLNLLYRYHHGDFDDGQGASIKLNNHAGFIGISARINRLFF